MSSRPEAIDSRLVLHVYSAAALPLGIISYSWPLIVPGTFPALDSNVRLRLAAAVLTALGTCGAALAQIDDPIGRRRGLIGFANVILPGKGLKEGPFVTEDEIRTMADVAADEDAGHQ